MTEQLPLRSVRWAKEPCGKWWPHTFLSPGTLSSGLVKNELERKKVKSSVGALSDEEELVTLLRLEQHSLLKLAGHSVEPHFRKYERGAFDPMPEREPLPVAMSKDRKAVVFLDRSNVWDDSIVYRKLQDAQGDLAKKMQVLEDQRMEEE